MPDTLKTAMEMHQTGQLASAARLYQQVLAHEQENADALHRTNTFASRITAQASSMFHTGKARLPTLQELWRKAWPHRLQIETSNCPV